MSEEKKKELTPEELEAQQGEELPEREVILKKKVVVAGMVLAVMRPSGTTTVGFGHVVPSARAIAGTKNKREPTRLKEINLFSMYSPRQEGGLGRLRS